MKGPGHNPASGYVGLQSFFFFFFFFLLFWPLFGAFLASFNPTEYDSIEWLVKLLSFASFCLRICGLAHAVKGTQLSAAFTGDEAPTLDFCFRDDWRHLSTASKQWGQAPESEHSHHHHHHDSTTTTAGAVSWLS